MQEADHSGGETAASHLQEVVLLNGTIVDDHSRVPFGMRRRDMRQHCRPLFHVAERAVGTSDSDKTMEAQ